MKNIFNLMILITFISCNKDVEKPKVSYKKSSKVSVKQIDTTNITVADLPIQFSGTNYLIYPIGSINQIEKNDTNFTISNNMDNEITGFLGNLKFQKTDSDEFVSLTDKSIFIESVTYLKSISDKTKKQILVYQLADNDSNDDGKLDTNDIKSLYLSDVSGANFTKVFDENQEVLTWKIIESQNRIYYKSIEDTNKNGRFDLKDQLHYGFVSLLEKQWKKVDYQPINSEIK